MQCLNCKYIQSFAILLIGLLIYVLHIAKVNAKEQDELEKQNEILKQKNNSNKNKIRNK